MKIDQTFVRELGRDARATAIVRSVVTLAKDLGLEVVAEGVETPEQAEVLGELGCQFAQGYLWAKAMPVDELARRLRAQQHQESGALSASSGATSRPDAWARGGRGVRMFGTARRPCRSVVFVKVPGAVGAVAGVVR